MFEGLNQVFGRRAVPRWMFPRTFLDVKLYVSQQHGIARFIYFVGFVLGEKCSRQWSFLICLRFSRPAANCRRVLKCRLSPAPEGAGFCRSPEAVAFPEPPETGSSHSK